MKEYRLAVDSTLIPLAKKMRTLGLDVAICQAKTPAEALVFCRKEKRLLLTKNKQLARFFEKYNQEYLLVTTEKEGLKVVLERFKKGKPRCPFCNKELVPIRREEAVGKVPVYVFLSSERFSRCPECGRVFWRGSHLRWIEEVIEHDFEGFEEDTGNRGDKGQHRHS
ncbi:Mut7-C RNAse domain-containing protein [Thermotoga sp. SG1]|uniref:Mut7-C RNAse domain-containing protein n=1 Tax=Thermotoga sp. SG1 TaxID=126739 RepID=UPI000C75AC26|nr:Mut7-C RNAse domain-containing protein [Thermotoga sp. SG1]PLV56340.1 hypothetical protein AS006_07245 [Thermotoga sp. SG1]